MANTFKETRIDGDLYVTEKIYKYNYPLGRYTEIGVDAVPATTISLGSIIVGKNLTIDRKGVLSARSYNLATEEAGGLMSADDKIKLNTIEENANHYVLPIADTNTLGGVKINENTSYIKKEEDGSITVNIGSKYIPGLLQVGDNLNVTEGGIVSVPLAQYDSEVQKNGLIRATDQDKINRLQDVAFSGSYTDLKDTPPDAGVYRLKGSIEYPAMIQLTDALVGDVWAISKDYTYTDPVKGQITIKAGTNYNCIQATSSSSLGPDHWVVFDPSKSIDLTKYVAKAEVKQNPTTGKSIVYTGSWKDIIDLSLATHDADGLLTKEDKTKLDGLHSVATSGEYDQLKNKPILAAVATSGDYNDLFNLPTFATIAKSGKYADLVTKPTSADGIVPVGTMILFAGGTLPDGYLLCNGSAPSRTTYSDLYGVIGVKYGEGNGSTTFNLPNFIDRFPEGGDSDTYATYVEAGLPNITGEVNGDRFRINSTDSGCFAHSSTTGQSPARDSASEENYNISFDASASNPIYGKSDTVQPKALKIMIGIKY